jgi:protein-S-isoprenylcysteine O-methyltransferase Ste14
MTSHELGIYGAHAAFWLMFAVGDRVARGHATPDASTTANDAPVRAPRARLLVAVHMVAFAMMYMGIGQAVFGRVIPVISTAQRISGALVILAGGAIAAWARIAFASWRFQAQLDAGHQLATGGPFRWIRHPIYTGLNLLAIGTAVWAPNVLTIAGAIAMWIGSELRARAEEPLLEQAFGDEYRSYQGRTRRFVPGLY